MKEDWETERSARFVQACRNCRVGTLQPHLVTYARWHGEHFVVLPNVPAWRCDFCGEILYDLDVLGPLRALLGPETSLDLDDRWLLDTESGDDTWGLGLSNRRRTDSFN